MSETREESAARIRQLGQQGKGLARGRVRPDRALYILRRCRNLGLRFVPDGKGNLDSTFGPEDLFAYVYVILYAPGYRARYATFLKTDFPRLPVTSDSGRFRRLVALGNDLIGIHLMKVVSPGQPNYPVAGNNLVAKFKLEGGRIYVNSAQYFEGVADAVWNYRIGGCYQVAHKWLKDRVGRTLTFNDLEHYRGVLAALRETIRIQGDIDAAIGRWPLT